MMARRGDDECDEGWRLTARRERRSDAQAQFVKMSFNAPPTLVAEAERTLAEQAQEQHAHEVLQQQDHEKHLAQIRRTERCDSNR